MMHDSFYFAGTYVCYALAAVCVISAVKIFIVKPNALKAEDLKKEQILRIRQVQIASGMMLLILGVLIGFSADYIVRFISHI